MKRIKFYLSLLLLNVSFVHGAQELDPVYHAPLQTQKVPRKKLGNVVAQCEKSIELQLSYLKSGLEYINDRICFFEPTHQNTMDHKKVDFALQIVAEEPTYQSYLEYRKAYERKELDQTQVKKLKYLGQIALKEITNDLNMQKNTINEFIDFFSNISSFFSEKTKYSFSSVVSDLIPLLLEKRLQRSCYINKKISASSDLNPVNQDWTKRTLTVKGDDPFLDLSSFWHYEKANADLQDWLLKKLYVFVASDFSIQQNLKYMPITKISLTEGLNFTQHEQDILSALDGVYYKYVPQFQSNEGNQLIAIENFYKDQSIVITEHLKNEWLLLREKLMASMIERHSAPHLVDQESEKLDELYKKIFTKPKKKRKKKKPANPSQPPLPAPQEDEKDVDDFENAGPPALPIEDKLPEFAPKPAPQKRTKAQKKADKRLRDQAKIAEQQSNIPAKQTVEDRYEQHHPHIKADHIFDALDQSEKTMMRDIFNHNASPNLNYAKIKTALHHMGITIEEKRGNGDFRKWKLPNGAKVFSFEPAVPQIGHHFLEILRKELGEKWGVTKEHFEG